MKVTVKSRKNGRKKRGRVRPFKRDLNKEADRELRGAEKKIDQKGSTKRQALIKKKHVGERNRGRKRGFGQSLDSGEEGEPDKGRPKKTSSWKVSVGKQKKVLTKKKAVREKRDRSP